MNAVAWTGIAVGVIGALGTIAAAAIAARATGHAAAARRRADERTADAEQAIAVINQWSVMVDALQRERTDLLRELADEREAHQDEIRRHVSELARCAESIAECEKRCRECHADRQDLIANVRALGALVTDEITKAAVVTVLDDNVDAVDDKVELDAIRAFLREARRQQRGRGDG